MSDLNQLFNDPDFLDLPESEQDSIVAKVKGTATSPMQNMDTPVDSKANLMEIAIKTATDPMLKNYGLDSQSRQAQEIYGKGREAVLNSDIATKMRSGVSDEPFATIPTLPLITDKPTPVSPRGIAKQIQGIGVDSAALGIGDAAIARGPAALAKRVIDPVAKAAENTGARFLNYYIKPRQAGFMFGKNPGRGVAKHIGPSMNRESLLSKIQMKNDDLLKQLSDAASKSGNPVEIGPVADAFKRNIVEMEKFPETFAGPLDAHKAFARDLDALISRSGHITPEGKVMLRPSEAIELKRAIGKIPSWNMTDPRLGSITKTSREAYGALDKSIDRAVPESAPLNQDISDLIGAEHGIKMGQQREQNKMPLGGLEILGALLAGSGNMFSPQGIGAASAIKLTRSAPFNTTIGSALGKSGVGLKAVSETLKKTERPSVVEGLFRKILGEKSKALVKRG